MKGGYLMAKSKAEFKKGDRVTLLSSKVGTVYIVEKVYVNRKYGDYIYDLHSPTGGYQVKNVHELNLKKV